MALEERFWQKVDKSGECWLWLGNIDAEGYGHCRSNLGTHIAHRISYMLVHGRITKDQPLDHRCLNRSRVRPDHLRLVTAKQNSEHRKGANANSASGVRGVRQHKNGRWRGSVGHKRRVIHVGYFDTITEAEAAVIAKRAELFTHDDHR